MKNSNFEGVINFSNLPTYAVTCNVSPGYLDQCNIVSFENQMPQQIMGYTTHNQIYFMNNSSTNLFNNNIYTSTDLPESTISSRRNTLNSFEDGRLINATKPEMDMSNKIGLLQKVLEGIHDDYQILITSKPKNKSNKIRKSNRHSRFRGVSLNGKKWQVMIMGTIK